MLLLLLLAYYYYEGTMTYSGNLSNFKIEHSRTIWVVDFYSTIQTGFCSNHVWVVQ